MRCNVAVTANKVYPWVKYGKQANKLRSERNVLTCLDSSSNSSSALPLGYIFTYSYGHAPGNVKIRAPLRLFALYVLYSGFQTHIGDYSVGEVSLYCVFRSGICPVSM